MRPPRVLAAAAVLAGWAAAATAQHPLVTLPLDDPAYVQLDGLVQLGCGAARISAFRPFMVKDVRAALARADSEPACAGRILTTLDARFRAAAPAADTGSSRTRLRLGGLATLAATGLGGGEFWPMWRDVRPTSQGTPPLDAEARLRLTFDGGTNIVLVSEAYAEAQRRNDPTVRASPLRRTSGVIDFSEAYAAARVGRVVILAGRGREAWLGEGTESMVLSANGPALDRITLTAQWERWEFHALIASVNDVVLSSATDSLADSGVTQRWHRMLLGHALTFRPVRRVELTVGETALLPRQGGGVDLSYVNPLMIYQVVQNDSARTTAAAGNANLTAFGSVRANVGRASLQGDLLIDDIQIDPKDRRIYPDLLGWNVRLTYALPLIVPTDVGFQYRRVGSYTYFEKYYTNTWQTYNQPVGSELGPDADMARLFASAWTLPRLELTGGVAYWRHGAQRIDQRPPPDRTGHAGEPFPSTTISRPDVQRALVLDASAQWVDGVIPLSAGITLAHIDHVNNLAADAGWYSRFQLSGSYRFRYP